MMILTTTTLTRRVNLGTTTANRNTLLNVNKHIIIRIIFVNMLISRRKGNYY